MGSGGGTSPVAWPSDSMFVVVEHHPDAPAGYRVVISRVYPYLTVEQARERRDFQAHLEFLRERGVTVRVFELKEI